MGSYVFRWPHQASEVHVTGTFDNWGTSVIMNKVGEQFEKEIQFDNADNKIYYKFIVDGNWTTDHAASQEQDEHNNMNNVLLPQHIKKHGTTSSTLPASMGSLATGGDQPTHGQPRTAQGDEVPGGFPQSPNTEEQRKLGGEDESAYGVNPIPASGGHGNPITLRPGEAIRHPDEMKDKSIASHATTDQQSYEAGGNGLTNSSSGATSAGAGAFSLPPISRNMIPESSLPMGGRSMNPDIDAGPQIQSAHPESSTAALAGGVPVIPRSERHATSIAPSAAHDAAPAVPAIVKDSQHAAGESPEAASSASAVGEKSKMEQELTHHVPLAKVTSDDSTHEVEASRGHGDLAAIGAGSAVVGAGTALGVAGTHSGSDTTKPVQTVPEPVRESLQTSHTSPEAITNPEAVAEKGAMESELLSHVKRDDSTGISAPTSHGGVATTEATEQPAKSVPEQVRQSLRDADADPEAAANPEAVREKSAMESELLSELPRENRQGMPAPTVSAMTSETAPGQGFAPAVTERSIAGEASSLSASEPSGAAVAFANLPAGARDPPGTDHSERSPETNATSSSNTSSPNSRKFNTAIGSKLALENGLRPSYKTAASSYYDDHHAPSTGTAFADTSAGNSGAFSSAATTGLRGPVSSQVMSSDRDVFTSPSEPTAPLDRERGEPSAISGAQTSLGQESTSLEPVNGPRVSSSEMTGSGTDPAPAGTGILSPQGPSTVATDSPVTSELTSATKDETSTRAATTATNGAPTQSSTTAAGTVTPIRTEKTAVGPSTTAATSATPPSIVAPSSSASAAGPASPALSDAPSSTRTGESASAKAERRKKRTSIFGKLKEKLGGHQ